jgi:hypothetical protein
MCCGRDRHGHADRRDGEPGAQESSPHSCSLL